MDLQFLQTYTEPLGPIIAFVMQSISDLSPIAALVIGLVIGRLFNLGTVSDLLRISVRTLTVVILACIGWLLLEVILRPDHSLVVRLLTDQFIIQTGV